MTTLTHNPARYSVVMLARDGMSQPASISWAGDAIRFINSAAAHNYIADRPDTWPGKPYAVVNVRLKPVPMPWPIGGPTPAVERTPLGPKVDLKLGERHCHLCHGSGLWATGMDDIPCHLCKGTGIDPASRVPDFGLFGREVPPE